MPSLKRRAAFLGLTLGLCIAGSYLLHAALGQKVLDELVIVRANTQACEGILLPIVETAAICIDDALR